jgi:chorismate mutase
MAGDWLKMTHALPEKPEVLAIASKTGLSRFDVVGRLFILWRWFDNNTTDGNAVGVTSVTLNECLFGYSDATNFVSAVVSAKWLYETSDSISVVKFDEHTSESAKQRAQTAKRVAKSKSKNKGNADGNAAAVTKTVPREEKRREEEKEIPPKPPKGGKPGPVGLSAWIEVAKASGEKLVPDGDPVFVYAESIGLPNEFLHLAWLEFKHQYQQPGAKRYIDWRAVFRKAVRGNWLKLWWLEGDKYALTTRGMQAQRAHQEKAA